MNVTYQDKVQQGDKECVLLQETMKRLEEVAGSSAALVSAEWRKTQDASGPMLYTLILSDLSEQVSATFSAEELQSPRRLRPRLLELWGDLLQTRSDAQLKKIQHLVAQGE